MQVKDVFYKIFKIRSNTYSLIGGVFLALSINLYTSLPTMSSVPENIYYILASAFLLFMAGIFILIISWNLDTINQIIINDAPKFMTNIEIEDTRKTLISGKFNKLCILLLLFTFFSIIGLLLLIPCILDTL